MTKVPSAGKPIFMVIVTYLAFISLGLPDGLLGIGWPYMSERSNVPLDSLGFMLITFTLGYLATSSTSGKITQHLSLGTLLATSSVVTALSLFAYAFSEEWVILLIAAFFLGSGGGAIDSSINTFAASAFSASTVNWLHAFYGVGATAGPLLITTLIANDFAWYNGYLVVAIAQLSLSALFFATKHRWSSPGMTAAHEKRSGYLETLRLPVVWVYVAIFFLYTGLEQGFGQWLFSILTRSRDVDAEYAGLLTSAYWGSLTVGRITFGIVLTRISVNAVLNGALTGIVIGTTLFALNINTPLSVMGIIILGMANAPVFPSLISITPARIGQQHTATAIGVQISMAMLGGALLPGFAGFLSDAFGLEIIPRVYAVAAIVLAALYFLQVRRSSKE